MKTYEVFTEKYSKIYQADGIESVIRKHHKVSNDEIVAVTIADRPDLLSKVEQLEPEGEVNHTEAIQKQTGEQYHLACQNCGTTTKPLQMVPFRNNDNVVGLLTACDGCKGLLYGQRFDREEKFTPQQPSEDDRLIGYVDYISELISYAAFLGKELDETATLAHVHGWRTTREAEGLATRERLDKLAKSLLFPLYTEAIKELNR